MGKCITVAVAGYGLRGKCYSQLVKKSGDRVKIVAVGEIDEEKLAEAKAEYDLADDMCFLSAEEMLEQPKLADIMFIATQDRQHVPQAVKAVERGYHVMVEKPISPDLHECLELQDKAHEHNRIVTVCHVLRYSAFYQKVKEVIESGDLGEVRNIQAVEDVGYFHQAHSFVRGNWRNSIETSPMILAKSCHDMDILQWLMNKTCTRISSYGSLSLFKEDKAPEGSADRCLDGCKCKEDCPYDAEKIYITNKFTGVRDNGGRWPCTALTLNPTEDTVYEALKTGPYGRCVYKCDNDVVDHQVVIMEFENGATVDFNMTAFTRKPGRQIRVMGTMGELSGDVGTGIMNIYRFGKEAEIVDVSKLANCPLGHAGGDARLVESTISMLESNDLSKNLTSIDASVHSHVMALAAEHSRLNNGVSVNLDEFIKNQRVLAEI